MCIIPLEKCNIQILDVRHKPIKTFVSGLSLQFSPTPTLLLRKAQYLGYKKPINKHKNSNLHSWENLNIPQCKGAHGKHCMLLFFGHNHNSFLTATTDNSLHLQKRVQGPYNNILPIRELPVCSLQVHSL